MPFFHRLAHGLVGVELRLLRQVADLQAGHRRGFAFDVVVDAGHDLQQRALARAVQAEHADLGAGEEGQRDVLQDLPLRRHDLADAVHGEDVLGHGLFFAEKLKRGAPGPATARYCRRCGQALHRIRIAATIAPHAPPALAVFAGQPGHRHRRLRDRRRFWRRWRSDARRQRARRRPGDDRLRAVNRAARAAGAAGSPARLAAQAARCCWRWRLFARWQPGVRTGPQRSPCCWPAGC